MVVLEQKYDLRLNGMQEKIEKQQEEIINLRKNQEELRSELGECIVEVKRVATPKDVQTLPNNIIVQKKIASHEKNFVTLKSSVRSIETTMRGVQKALFRQKLFGKSCHSKHNNVTIARLQELEKQFTNLSKEKRCNASLQNQSPPSTPTAATTRQQEIEPTNADEEHGEFQQGVQFSGLVMNHNDSRLASDCFGIYGLGYRKNGVYRVRLDNTDVRIKCNLRETPRNWNMDNRLANLTGWIVIQNRRTASDFNRSWEEYKRGFGNLQSDFWLGNEVVYKLMNRTTDRVYLFIRFYVHDFFYYDRFLARNIEMGDEKSLYKISHSGLGYTNRIVQLTFPQKSSFSSSDNFDQRDPRCPVADSGWWRPGYPSCVKYNKNPNTPYSMSANDSNTGGGVWGFQHNDVYIIGSEILIFINTSKIVH
ncbi:hypothetical protein ScPMuIL_002418 [Solemya velum]